MSRPRPTPPPATTVDSPPDSGTHDAETTIPPVYRRRQGAMLAGFAVLALGMLALADTPFSQGLVSQWATLSIAGIGFYLAFGLGGQFSFCQAALVGTGAYASAWLTQDLGLPFLVGLVGAAALSAAVATLLYLLIRRCDAFYFAIATLAFGFLGVVIFREWTAFAGAGGERRSLIGISPFGDELSGRWQPAFIVGVLIVGIALALLLERSPLGREASAVRNLPEVAPTLGINAGRIKLATFVAGAAYSGLAGSLIAHRMMVVSPEAFDIPFALDLFLILLFGGLGSAWGPVCGAAFVVWAPEQLRFIGNYQDLVFGILLILIMIFVPNGLVGIAQRVKELVAQWRTKQTDTPAGVEP